MLFIQCIYLFIFTSVALYCFNFESTAITKGSCVFFHLYCYEAMPFVLNKADKSQGFNWWLLTVKLRETNYIFKL